jgi:replication factor C subunit 3/5
MFLLDRYHPKNENDMVFHRPILKTLKSIARSSNVPHIAFGGPEGSGKSVLINMYLANLFENDDVRKLQPVTYKVTSAGNNNRPTVEVMQSNCHIEIEPNQNNFDRYIIQDVIKEYARQIPMQVFGSGRPYRAVVIHGIDQMSKYAQTCLRRTMEDFSEQCRFVLCCRSFNSIIRPIRSRCFCIRVSAPTMNDVYDCIVAASLRSGVRLTLDGYDKLMQRCTRDLRQSFRELEALRWNVSSETSYDKKIGDIVGMMLRRKSESLPAIRLGLYDMTITVTTFAGTQIIKDITERLLDHPDIPEDDKIFITDKAAIFEHRNVLGRREIKHLEAFVISVMRRVKLPQAAPLPKKPSKKIPTTSSTTSSSKKTAPSSSKKSKKKAASTGSASSPKKISQAAAPLKKSVVAKKSKSSGK